MSNRLEAIKKLEESRGSKIICYITGDRQPFLTQINEEVIPILYRHLELMGVQEKIDLFLYTRGGDMVVPIRIVKLIRNYCKKFSILIPYRCHSAGTLISLGADEIIMTNLAELTPVDPTSNVHVYNPKGPNPQNPLQQIILPVSVEDVRSYLSFAKEELGAQEAQIVDLYAKMTQHPFANNTDLHPLALGNVYRVQKMIKIITKRLLKLHSNRAIEKDEHKISAIIKEITENISVHNYPIYFDEAKELGLDVKRPDKAKEEESLIWGLFQIYSEVMKLNSTLNLVEEIGANNTVNGSCIGQVIESIKAEDTFNFTYQIAKNPQNPALLNFAIPKQQWEKIR